MNENRLETIEALRTIAHQWRQPLNLISMEAINLIVQGNMDTEVSSKDVIKSANIISEQTQRMSDVLKSILNIGKGQRAKELFSINEFFQSIDTYFLEQLKEKELNLEINYLKEDLKIYGYIIDLQEVIVNLVSNAKDAYINKQNNKANTISLSASVVEENYVLSVKDNAGGIPEPMADKIFESNFSTKSGSKGFGIGLYIAKIIIEHEFNGSITLKSNERGAEFFISIPRNDLNEMKFIK